LEHFSQSIIVEWIRITECSIYIKEHSFKWSKSGERTHAAGSTWR